MSTTLLVVIIAAEALFMGGMFLLYPRFARRGLLFGVYVGELAWSGPEARDLTRWWYRGMITWLAVSLAGAIALAAFVPGPVLVALFPLAAVTGFVQYYLRAYFRAKRFAVTTPPPAVALLQDVPPPSLWLPLTALVVGVISGVVALTYAAVHYAELPAQVPTHFGATGAPDDWRPKSFFSVMLLPIMTLLMGVGMGGMSIMTAHAKRAVRYPNTEISLQAQLRFRRAVTRMISTISILVAVMLGSLSVGSVRVGLGLARGLPPAMMALTLAVMVVGIGGTLYIGLRYGQGGSRWERQAADAPLMNGLADNRRWVLGVFYFNRDDPSYMVEDRFGLGYTLNLGNLKAVALVFGFLGGLFALVLAALALM